MTARNPRKIDAKPIEPRFDNESWSFTSFEDQVSNRQARVEMETLREKAKSATPTPQRTPIMPSDARGKAKKANWRAPRSPGSKLGPSGEQASPEMRRSLRKSQRKSEQRRQQQLRNPFKNTEPILFEDGRNWRGNRA